MFKSKKFVLDFMGLDFSFGMKQTSNFRAFLRLASGVTIFH